MTDVLVNLAGLAAIGLIVWWFWLARSPAIEPSGSGPIEIVVDSGAYEPAAVRVPVGRPVTLRFLRKDPSPCAAEVRFERLGVAAELPVGEAREVTVTAPAPGEYEFSCAMRMYRGVLRAR